MLAVLPVLVVVALPLSTAAQEIALGLALAAALLRAREIPALPFVREAAAVALVWVLSALVSGNLHEGLGHAWLLAPLVALPLLPRHPRVEAVGVAAAVAAALWGLAQRAGGTPAHGGFSHHLSFAYALVPPFTLAVARRWWPAAALLAAGALASGSDALPVVLVVALAALRRPLLALGVGAVVTLVALPFAAAHASFELHQRAILWTGAASLVPLGGVGAGAYAAASALPYDHLERGFWFPNHAHDTLLQVLAVLGPAGFVAQLALVWAVLRRGARPAAAALAAVLVGGLSQDVLGDLEVARALWVWLALLGTAPPAEGPRG